MMSPAAHGLRSVRACSLGLVLDKVSLWRHHSRAGCVLQGGRLSGGAGGCSWRKARSELVEVESGGVGLIYSGYQLQQNVKFYCLMKRLLTSCKKYFRMVKIYEVYKIKTITYTENDSSNRERM